MRKLGKLTAKILVGALVVALNVTGAGAASAEGFFTIEHFGNVPDLCLQPEGGVTQEPVPIVLHRCNGSAEQRWLFHPFGGTDRWEIANAATNLCWNAFDGAHNNARVLQIQCVPISNEQWKTSRTPPDVMTIMSRERFSDTNFCVDVPNNNPFEGAAVQLFKCNTTDAQKWAVRTA